MRAGGVTARPAGRVTARVDSAAATRDKDTLLHSVWRPANVRGAATASLKAISRRTATVEPAELRPHASDEYSQYLTGRYGNGGCDHTPVPARCSASLGAV
jgi:hypothetical protein